MSSIFIVSRMELLINLFSEMIDFIIFLLYSEND